MRKSINNISITVLLFLCVGCDQGTKKIAQNFLSDSGAITFFADIFRFQYIENQGAFLGLGSSLPETFRFYFFAVFMTAVMIIAFYVFLNNKNKFTKFQAVLIVFIFAGGTGNLIDRFFNDGRVIDFMNIGIGRLRTGIFNVADVFILFGALLFSITMALQRDSQS